MSTVRRVNEFPLWMHLITLFPLFVWKSAYDSFHEPKWLLLTVGVGALLLVRIPQNKSLFRPKTVLDLPIWICLGVTLVAWRWDAPDRWIAFMFWLRIVLIYLLFRFWVSDFSRRDSTDDQGAAPFDLVLALVFGMSLVLKEWVLSPQQWAPTQVWSLVVLFCLVLRWFLQHHVLKDAYTHAIPFQRLLDCFLVSGAGIAMLTIIQDWGVARWSTGPVSDWRFHLSSTLGNPNEVGGYLSYLIPALIYRVWLSKEVIHRFVWCAIGFLYLYALTTVFTVGAWLGLFVVLPISLILSMKRGDTGDSPKANALFPIILSAGIFFLLQGSMRVPISGGLRTAALVIGGIVLLSLTWFGLKGLARNQRQMGTLMIAALLSVWVLLLVPWGIPNHPQGLVEEAISSPRWKGGFGARRFIWRTTGLMVIDHPLRGIGWGNYYFIHAKYQGELYSRTDKPHDRPTVGQVPQVHSDPLQMLAETGLLGSISILWLGFAALGLGLKRLPKLKDPHERGFLWAAWTGFGLIAFHSAVDFPFRQPQPAVLAVFFLSAIATVGLREDGKKKQISSLGWACLPLAVGFILLGYSGFRDQIRLKTGFETFMQANRVSHPDLRLDRFRKSAEVLDGIRYPLPETQDKWLYLARVHMVLGDYNAALNSLEEARKYRHSLSLYQTWKEYGQSIRSPKVVLDSVLGLSRYNPNWAGYHKEAADLWKLLGEPQKAEEATALAKKFKVKSKE